MKLRHIALVGIACSFSVLVACPNTGENPDGDPPDDTEDAGNGGGDGGTPDAGLPPEGEGDACDAATYEDRCVDGKVRFCGRANQQATIDTILDIDCAVLTSNPATTCGPSPACNGAGCADLPAVTCIAPDDGLCVGLTATEMHPIHVVSCGPDSACSTSLSIEDPGLGRDSCVPAPTARCSPSGSAPNCEGDHLLICIVGDDVVFEMPLVLDCQADAAERTCSPEQATCINGPAGAYCDDYLFLCADGLDCVNNACAAAGTP